MIQRREPLLSKGIFLTPANPMIANANPMIANANPMIANANPMIANANPMIKEDLDIREQYTPLTAEALAKIQCRRNWAYG